MKYIEDTCSELWTRSMSDNVNIDTYLHDTVLIVNLTESLWFLNCGLIPIYNCNGRLFLLLRPWREPHEWPKHACDCYVINFHSYTQVKLLVFLKIVYFWLKHGAWNIKNSSYLSHLNSKYIFTPTFISMSFPAMLNNVPRSSLSYTFSSFRHAYWISTWIIK
jgi:hypothetical protein